ncbi:hypothetical protein GY661_24100, partial [Escherichia coli]|nr:hypothetical protein [Escherichia coli]
MEKLARRLLQRLDIDRDVHVLRARAQAPFVSIEDVWRRSRVKPAALERLARADAFRALGLDRRRALW